jgi:hypothetical protein
MPALASFSAFGLALALWLGAGLASPDAVPPAGWTADVPVSAVQPACEPVDRMPLEGRASPYDSVAVTLGGTEVKLCYGRPSARGRTMIGGEAVPFGELWRAGANEPTTLHVTGMIGFGNLHLMAGSYSIYTRPGEENWEVYVNRSTDRWGIPINEGVREQEVGSITVPRERPDAHVETLTYRFGEVDGARTELILEWENFRVRIPVESHGL